MLSEDQKYEKYIVNALPAGENQDYFACLLSPADKELDFYLSIFLTLNSIKLTF